MEEDSKVDCKPIISIEPEPLVLYFDKTNTETNDDIIKLIDTDPDPNIPPMIVKFKWDRTLSEDEKEDLTLSKEELAWKKILK